jgi:hypothetical protein
MDQTAANIDLENAIGISGEPPCSPNSQSTWQSQTRTLNSPIVEQIDPEHDFEEESGKFSAAELVAHPRLT